jgi:hypothetical protein
VVSTSANRSSKEEQQIVGLLMRSSWLLLEPRPDELFADLVQRAAGRLVLSMRNCRFDPAAALAEIARLDLPYLPNFYFNFADVADDPWAQRQPERPGDVAPETLWVTMPIGGGGCPLELNFYPTESQLEMVIKYDSTLFKKEDIYRLLLFYDAASSLITANPAVRVQELFELTRG